MNEVDRWYPNGYGEMQDYHTGEYVLFTDYEALRARLAEAERLLYAAARRVPPAFLSCDELTADGDLRYWHDEYTAFRLAGRTDSASEGQP